MSAWQPITEFLNDWAPHPEYPPEFKIWSGGALELRGAMIGGEVGKPCARLPEHAWTREDEISGNWYGFEHERYNHWIITADGFVTIVETTKYELLADWLGRVAS